MKTLYKCTSIKIVIELLIYFSVSGPHEPDKNKMYRWMEPIADELRELYNGVNMPVLRPNGQISDRIVKALLILVSCDAPGLRRILGFCGHTSGSHFCSKCKRAKQDIPQFSMEPAAVRTLVEHQQIGAGWLREESYTSKDVYAKANGYRYNPFVNLTYFDSVRFHVIDAMHSLLLGSGKHLLMTMKRQGLFGKPDYIRMQNFVDQIKCPREVGAVPGRLESMSHLKADQVLFDLIRLNLI
jgi:hypothetical protein